MEQKQKAAEITILAEPEPVVTSLGNTAIIVVDMQNGFVREGGFADKLLNLDISRSQRIIDPCKRILKAARDFGMKVIYLKMAYMPDLSDAGGPDSIYRHKEHGLVKALQHPEIMKDIMIDGTWNTEIIDELKPGADDLIIRKPYFSGFVGTELDIVLKTYHIKYLIFAGVATNICVGSTVRDAYHRGYFPILISDATASFGPEYTHDAEIWNAQFVFGWVTTTDDLTKSLHEK